MFQETQVFCIWPEKGQHAGIFITNYATKYYKR